MRDTREQMCSGCGSFSHPLSHSHIISRAKRKDLTHDINNITYHCLSMGGRLGCHDIWEHGTLEEKEMLMDYDQNMEYIKRVDLKIYHQLMMRRYK